MKNLLVYVPPAKGAKEVFTEEAIAAFSTANGHFYAPTRTGMSITPILPEVLDHVGKPKT